MSQADFAADYSDADVMDVSDHQGGLSRENATGGGGSHTRALIMTWVFVVAVWWGLHFLFKGQLS